MKIIESAPTYQPINPTSRIPNYNFLQPYVSIKPEPRSKKMLVDFIKSVEHFLPSPLPAEELHITVIYATNECNFNEIRKSISSTREYQIQVRKADLFINAEPNQEPSVHLVLLVHCPELHKTHNFLRKNIGLFTSFPEYKPHITVSSNAHLTNPNLTFDQVVDIYQQVANEMNQAFETDSLNLVFTNEKLEKVK